MSTTDASSKLNLVKIMEDMFLVLSQKEKEVIIKRFSLNNEPKMTLESIGQQYSVTRERIRQIEKIALSKLRRTLENTKLLEVTKLASELLSKCGGLCLEETLVSEIMKGLHTVAPVDSYIVKLSLSISPDFSFLQQNERFYPTWMLASVKEEDVAALTDIMANFLGKKKDVMTMENLGQETAEEWKLKEKTVTADMLHSLMAVDMRFKRVKESIGLMTWRHINPKSIRDKAYIVLKREAKPLHFVEIANKIAESAFDKKVVTTQAVHNELIRDEHFVLVGRGLYGLKEWGYKRGTVSDVIEDLLRKKSPLTKQEIMAGVLKQRHVKKGTISLNLQKNPQFVRVGRAVYTLDEGKKSN